MKPVAIFRHSRTEGPGYFAIFLEQHGIPWTLIPVDKGCLIPKSPESYSGLCFMGGPMSVNDPLPWIEEICQLIVAADQQGLPMIGHCLGGQLMSKALGGKITRNAYKEIGWSEAFAETTPVAKHWLGEFNGQTATLFQWHGETFSLPEQATRLLTNTYCANQMFALGKHLGMQCHVEMTPEMIASWCEQWSEEINQETDLSAVQTPETIAEELEVRLPKMRALADQLYGTWIQGLVK